MAEPVVKTWEMRSPAGIEDTWASLSDTDRFNRIAGLGFQYPTLPEVDGTQRRRGWARFMLGIRADWEEEPFQMKAPDWFRITRNYIGGPVAQSVVTTRLKAEPDGGTSIRYSVALTPRFGLASLLAQAELAWSTGPALERALRFVIAELSGKGLPEPLKPPALSADAEKRLEQADLGPAPVKEALVQTLRGAPLREQDRLQPLRLAQEWEQPEGDVVQAFLAATRQGVLSMRWEIICPLCLGPSARPERLDLNQRRVHCPSCNVHFDGTFPDSVAVVFRPAPAIRTFEVPIDCAGSPARTPHILMRERLEPNHTSTLDLPLSPGAYRLRTWPPRETFSLEVIESAQKDGVELALGELRFTPARAEVRHGKVKLQVDHAPGRAVDLIVERLHRPEGVLTAGRLLGWPGARDLLPEGVVDPSLKVEVGRGVVLALPPDPKGERALQLALREAGADPVVVGERGALGLFASARAALSAARSRGHGAIAAGPVLNITSADGRKVPMGTPIDRALGLLPMADSRVVMAAESDEDPEIAEALAELGMRAVDPPWGARGPGGALSVVTR